MICTIYLKYTIIYYSSKSKLKNKIKIVKNELTNKKDKR